MNRIKAILIGVVVAGFLAGFGASQAFAEVPNGRVSSNPPEPAGTLEATSTGEATEEAETITAEETAETATEDTAVDETSEEATEAEENSLDEMWPVYISLGGIALTLLLILIINIVHRKSKK